MAVDLEHLAIWPALDKLACCGDLQNRKTRIDLVFANESERQTGLSLELSLLCEAANLVGVLDPCPYALALTVCPSTDNLKSVRS